MLSDFKELRMTPSALWNKAMESVFFKPFQSKSAFAENSYQDFLGRPLKKERKDQFFTDRHQILLRIGELDEASRNQWYEKLSEALFLAKVFDPFRDSHALLKTELGQLTHKISNNSELKQKINISIEQQMKKIMKNWSSPVPEEIKNNLRQVLQKVNLALMINRTTELMPKAFQYLSRKNIESIPWRESHLGVTEMFIGKNRDYYCFPIAMLMTTQLKHLLSSQAVNVEINYPVTHDINKIIFLNNETHANIRISLGEGFDFILEPQYMKTENHFLETILPVTKRSVTLNYPRALSFYYSEIGADVAQELISDYKNKLPIDKDKIDLAKQYLSLSMTLDPLNARASRSYARLVHFFREKYFPKENDVSILEQTIKKDPYYLSAYTDLGSFVAENIVRGYRDMTKEDLKIFEKLYLGRQYLSAIILESKRADDSLNSDQANLKIISDIMLSVYALLEASRNTPVAKWFDSEIFLWKTMILIEDIPLSAKARKKVFTQNQVAILFKEKIEEMLGIAVNKSIQERNVLINDLSKDYSNREGAKQLVLKKYQNILKRFQNGND